MSPEKAELFPPKAKLEARRILILVLALLSWPAGAAEPPRLAFPVDCRIGETCWVVQTMNHGALGAVRDYACGQRSSPGHESTDIAVRDMVAVGKGVPVLAAAAGTVAARRSGMPDGGALAHPESVKDRECGNGVVIDHGNGWLTQYCHLRNDSITVQAGDPVAPRQVIGLVGLSGDARHPHLSFTLRNQDRAVDPFVGVLGLKGCGLGEGHLWAREEVARLSYSPIDIAVAGISDVVPTSNTVTFGAAGKDILSREAPAMILWARMFGVQAGDEVTLRLSGPDGQPFVQDVHQVTDDQPVYTRYAGQPRKGGRWPAGDYHGEVTVSRSVRDGPPRQWRHGVSVTVR